MDRLLIYSQLAALLLSYSQDVLYSQAPLHLIRWYVRLGSLGPKSWPQFLLLDPS